jgi:hypothetical protein
VDRVTGAPVFVRSPAAAKVPPTRIVGVTIAIATNQIRYSRADIEMFSFRVNVRNAPQRVFIPSLPPATMGSGHG